MPKYSFTAKSQRGDTYSGGREAKDEYELARVLRQEGYILISATVERKEDGSFEWGLSLFSFLGGVPFKEKMFFARNLRIMIGAGVSLPKALDTLSHQTENKKLKQAILSVRSEIISGGNFSGALGKYPDIFSELFCSMVKVGEESGTLENNLSILARQMEREQDLRTKVQSAMVYPAVIILTMLGIGVLMLITVVPKLAETFEELGVELPLTTRLVIWLSNFLVKNWYFSILISVIFISSIRIFLRIKRGRRLFDIITLRIPVISSIIKKNNSANIIRNLSSLTAAGIPLLRALEIISATTGNFYYQKAILEAIEKVKKGGKLSEALKPYQDIFSLTVIQMIEVGEETGETSGVLEKLGDFFEEEVATATKNLVAVIEPVLMLVIGGVVGFFAISMVQPLYSVLQGLE